jgi:hypothetical protein
MLAGHHACIGYNKNHDCPFKIAIFDKSEELGPPIGWFIYFGLKTFIEAYFLHFYPRFLLLCDEHVSKLLFFFNGIKVINNYSDEKIDYELGSNNHKGDEEPYILYL